jgi:V8-like Glu-specific endopeptidase
MPVKSLHVYSLVFVALLAVLSSSAKADVFSRGDVDGSGQREITDAIMLLKHVFLGDPKTLQCEDAGDVDDSGNVEFGDAIVLLVHLFVGSVSPRSPYPECGLDRTQDSLGCGSAPACKHLETVVSKSLRFVGDVVEKLPSGILVREVAIYRGRRFLWNGKVENRIATSEKPVVDRDDRTIDDISLEQLAKDLQALALFEGHEFLEAEPAWDLAKTAKQYEALVRQGAPREKLERLIPTRIPFQGTLEPTTDFASVEGSRSSGVPIDNPDLEIQIPDTLRKGSAKIVHGLVDDRSVKNNTSYPHRTHVVFDNTGATNVINGSQGSGTLIGPSTAMSVAHVFWDENNDTWEASHRRANGYDSQDADPSPFGEWYRGYWVTIPMGYVNNENSRWDYAIVDFDTNSNSIKNGVNSDSPGNTVGWLGWYVASASDIESNTGYVRGYPGNGTCAGVACNVRVWGDFSSSSENDARSRTIRHQADTSGGMSGSAFYIYENPSCNGCGYGPYLTGMHRAGAAPYNIARRFTSSVASFMQSYSSDY